MIEEANVKFELPPPTAFKNSIQPSLENSPAIKVESSEDDSFDKAMRENKSLKGVRRETIQEIR